MKLNQLVVGKSYVGAKGVVRTIREIAPNGDVYFLEDAKHLVCHVAGQEFAAWARTFTSTLNMRPLYLSRGK